MCMSAVWVSALSVLGYGMHHSRQTELAAFWALHTNSAACRVLLTTGIGLECHTWTSQALQ